VVTGLPFRGARGVRCGAALFLLGPALGACGMVWDLPPPLDDTGTVDAGDDRGGEDRSGEDGVREEGDVRVDVEIDVPGEADVDGAGDGDEVPEGEEDAPDDRHGHHD